MSKILLGTDLHGEKIYLYNHKWDCGWYWGFGYLGNNNMHFHFNSYLQADVENWTDINARFSKTKLTQDQWWILLDLFKIAYKLKEAAEVMRHGGHMTLKAKDYRVEFTPQEIETVNKRLEHQLDIIWNLLTEWLGDAK